MITTKDKTISQITIEIMQALINQGKQCSIFSGCCYDNGEGAHCAVGWLLPEGEFSNKALDVDVHGLLAEHEGELGENEEWMVKNESFLSILQELHDCGYPTGRFSMLKSIMNHINSHSTTTEEESEKLNSLLIEWCKVDEDDGLVYS